MVPPPPPFNQIKSVLNHMWGKGRRLEIHNNTLQRSVIVRILNEFLIQKIVDKNIWYVGDSMFHTAQWSSIWANLMGVLLDLRYQHGLILVAGLIGDPKETDDFTLNLVSLTLSQVKVEVDLTKPLSKVVEFERQSEQVVQVHVDYTWMPPTCSHCQELDHLVRNYLKFTPPKESPTPASFNTKAKKKGIKTQKKITSKCCKEQTLCTSGKPTPPIPRSPIPSRSTSLPLSPFAPKSPILALTSIHITKLSPTKIPSGNPKKYL
ncbi:hypothetical protein N665_0049s0008 [Sinapis alba]|nr:hypothetical protein N665_0049s0008 [Sinapis alba]